MPHYGERGLNSGVLLANLTHLRSTNFTTERDNILRVWGKEGRDALVYIDQDIVNLYALEHGDSFHVLPCRYNVR